MEFVLEVATMMGNDFQRLCRPTLRPYGDREEIDSGWEVVESFKWVRQELAATPLQPADVQQPVRQESPTPELNCGAKGASRRSIPSQIIGESDPGVCHSTVPLDKGDIKS